jgi:hypothetical protein
MLLLVRSGLCNEGLYCKFCLNIHAQVILNMLHQLHLSILERTFVSRVVLIKSDPLGPIELPLVKFDPLLSGMNDLVGGAILRFYQGV